MKQILWIPAACALLWGCSNTSTRTPQSETTISASPWVVENFSYDLENSIFKNVELRGGYYKEASQVPFKGCVLFLEGLGDSVVNHGPLFGKLSQNGYRVVFFDFMGQGGSQGSMNNSRILDLHNPALQISTQAKTVWSRYEKVKTTDSGKDCSESPKMVIAWSTGGLVGYRLANERWANAVVLISPALYPRKFLGEGFKDPKIMLALKPVITERTLTRNKFVTTPNPHVEPVKPTSPAHIPLFAANLLYSAGRSHAWSISKTVKGLVFIAGPADAYVEGEPLEKKLLLKAPHFELIPPYEGAFHELDNELPEVASDVHDKTIKFLDSVVAQP